MAATPSGSAIVQARLAAALILGLIILGAVWYGISFESLDRLWKDILARPGGPMTFRFILQRAMAAIAAFRDGVEDARIGRAPYISSMLRGVKQRGARLWESVVATAKSPFLGVVIDSIYQGLVFWSMYPAQAAVMAKLLLALVPYLLLRGSFERVARDWVARQPQNN